MDAGNRAFLVKHATDSRSEHLPAIRKAFPSFKGSDQSVLGARYHQTTGSSKGLDANITALESKLDALRAQRDAAESVAAAKLVRETQDAVHEAFPRPATAAQVAILKGGAKAPAKNAVAKVLDAALAKPAEKVPATKAAPRK